WPARDRSAEPRSPNHRTGVGCAKAAGAAEGRGPRFSIGPCRSPQFRIVLAVNGADRKTGGAWTMARDAADSRAGVREWIGLGVIALPCIIYAMDLTVLNLAIPQITVALKPTAAELLWIADIYGFLIAGLLLVMGALGDRIGRRKLLLLGALGFGLT